MLSRRWVAAAAACAVLVSGCSAASDSEADADTSTVPTVLILDGSGSMNENDAPGPRIDAAKSAAHGLIDALPDTATIGLQTYGTTTGSTPADKPISCQDVTTLLTVDALDRAAIGAAVDGITPSGFTPMSRALQHAADALPADGSAQAIILVSDGEETCDVPPCDVAAQLKQERPGLAISTVGFKVDGPAADQLRCIAEAAGGISVQASNAKQLAARLLATQDLEQANSSLSASGIHGVKLGDTIEDIRARYANFPDGSGRTDPIIVWRDSEFAFKDGALQSITPRVRARTIDGITIGDPVSAATALYGEPIDAAADRDGSIVFTYDADPNSDAAYRITAHASGVLTGTMKAIVLCLCKPQAVPPAPAVEIDADTVANMTFPPGTCGDSSYGWGHDFPITVTDGEGEARTPSGEFGGASITEAMLIGSIDGDRDGTTDAVVSFTCFGSTFDMCCAGRSSMMEFIGVFDFSTGQAVPVGRTIFPGSSPIRGETYGESRYIDRTRVEESAIITEEKLIYADTSGTTADLGHSPYATIEVTHRFDGGQWVSAERVIG